ncbi:ABC transporter ATP-binding protein, partial [Streptomyces sp. NPDC058442]
EAYRTETGAALLAVGHDRTLLDRWCDRTVHWDTVAAPGAPTAKAS